MVRRRLLATLAGVATTVLVAAGGAYASIAAGDAGDAGAAGGTEAAGAAGPSGPLADEMAAALEQNPGGIQLSDNAMAWDDGDVIAVWPSPGADAAPFGLGDAVRTDVVEALGITGLAQPFEPFAGDMQARGSASTCPSGYYCFYTASNFDGTRYQFSSTCSGYASSWGFDNTASSWVNRNSGRNYHAYDYVGGARLWTMTPGASDSYVGASADNRMSYWTCTSA
ncbi:peptidase inhibitor family I36 protein [Jiangella alba]|uniref:Peptidase inhibitor family I36 n=2 Tax=Jiangella alba TaxID=561176 RepID=A0A1H5PVF0_9ACTN|nr:peptidase inhibitor family I36 protein [Jiangella alba]SEF17715.1 Peptidase inhibitor family I36 [Jiangella alba]